MALIVQKFGGTSLDGVDRIQAVARRIARRYHQGDRLVIVVSAMGDTTDRLYRLALAVCRRRRLPRQAPPATPSPKDGLFLPQTLAPRELDMLLTAGERQAMALLSMALFALGCPAQSFTGSQVGIITDRFHSDARIQEVRLQRLLTALRQGKIPIVAGFQGMSEEREITTLGRGGSDVTAVALAAVLRADRCELYKDVDGIFTENPVEFPGVKPLPEITFEELAELAQAGAEVIHPRACALAEKYRVPLFIRSSFNNKRGTMVTDKKLASMERAFVRAITHQHRLARVALIDVKKKQRCLHQVVTTLTAARIPVFFFSHGITHGDTFDLVFIIPSTNLATAEQLLEQLARKVQAKKVAIDDNIASVSLVGPGVGTDMEIISDTFATLHQAKVHLEAFALAATRLTCFIRPQDLRPATVALLSRFRLTKSTRSTG